MRGATSVSAAAIGLAMIAGSPTARGQGAPLAGVRLTPTFSGALFMGAPRTDYHRLFVVEQAGRIKIIRDGALLPAAFLDVTALTNSSGWIEWGLLGLAFDPDFATNRTFYVYHTAADATGTSVIARYQASAANPDVADTSTRTVVMTIPHSFVQHRAGWMDFGPDGFLYIASGDGGPEGDTQHHAQNTNLLEGKILRIDPRTDAFPADPNRNYSIPPGNPYAAADGADEIWALGFRNPWRCSFDRLTGDIWIGDVGQSAREEVDFLPAGTPGLNFGWDCMEGFLCTSAATCTCNSPSLTRPIYDYVRQQGVSVTGGYVYRGCAIPAISGRYFFSDWTGRKLWSFVRSGATYTDFTDWTAAVTPAGATIGNVRSFGEDAYGELYFTDGTQIFKLVPPVPITDCNGNGRPDACDIASAQSADANHNSVPDECESCYANCDASTVSPALNVMDFTCFLQRFAAGDAYANCDQSTTPPALNVQDFSCFLQKYAAGCP